MTALRAREVRPGTERGTEDCACRDTNTIVQTAAHLPTSAPWRNINCRPAAPIVAPSRRDRSCAFRQYRRVPPSSRRRWGNFPPAWPVTGPAADAAAALVSKFPVASGRKSCSETEAGATRGEMLRTVSAYGVWRALLRRLTGHKQRNMLWTIQAMGFAFKRLPVGEADDSYQRGRFRAGVILCLLGQKLATAGSLFRPPNFWLNRHQLIF
jgi:hypothetical protein